MPPSIPSPTLLIKPTPLTESSFAQFGTLIQNPAHSPKNPTTKKAIPANQGSATKYIDVSDVTNFYPQSPSKKPAKAVMNMYVCSPRRLRERDSNSTTSTSHAEKVFDVQILERHPYTPQTFIPIGLTPDDKSTQYLIIVAPTLSSSNANSIEEWPRGPGLPDLVNIRAFLADGSQAVTYGPGTWHSPMVVIGEKPIDFVVVQYANGVADEDCQEVFLESGVGKDGISVAVELSSSKGLWEATKGFIEKAKL